MKKLFLSMLAILLCLSAFVLIACNGDDNTTTDNFTTTNGDNVTTTSGDNVTTLPPPSPDCDHVEEIIKGKEPTTSNTGYTDGKKCTLCGGILESQYVIPALKFVDGFEYRLNEGDDSYTVTGIGAITDINIVIPSEYNGLPVTSIGREAFKDCKSIKSVVIPDSVRDIEVAAFINCEGLESINIPNGVSHINNSTFSHCEKLKTINIPSSVTYIGASSFERCVSLTELPIGNNVTYVGFAAYSYCTGITEVTLPDSLTDLSGAAFSDCENLKSANLGKGIRRISNRLFYNCISLESVITNEKITSIGESAFEYCVNLTEFEIPEGVTEIGFNVFAGCDNLSKVFANSHKEWTLSKMSAKNIKTHFTDPSDNAKKLKNDYVNYIWRIEA